MQTIRIRNGHAVDPSTGLDGLYDIVVNDDRIGGVYPAGHGPASDIEIDAEGLWVLPGLVDMHVHFREPGQEHKETIKTGAAAAAHGGVTSVLTMPNTTPPLDSPELIARCIKQAEDAPCHVYPIASITRGMQGKENVDFSALKAAGAAAFSEDGRSVLNARLLRDAMICTSDIDRLVISHCEDPDLVKGGVMNEDENAQRLHLPGICTASEDVIIARDAVLAAETGAHVHICHCSTAGSVSILRAAKKLGVRITAETCPHYLILTTDDITEDDGRFKMNPPLRTAADREALRAALADDTIDVIVTDHAPHASEEKQGGFLKSAFGIVGLETSAALIYTELVRTGILSLSDMVRKMSTRPAEICGLDAGTLRPGAPADIAVFDFDHAYEIDPAEFRSKSRNMPFAGRRVYGKCMYTLCGGKIVYSSREDRK